jgi:hypothetical protein
VGNSGAQGCYKNMFIRGIWMEQLNSEAPNHQATVEGELNDRSQGNNATWWLTGSAQEYCPAVRGV